MAVIVQMMFVSGETGEVPGETTTLIEQIVQQQVVEMVGPMLNIFTQPKNGLPLSCPATNTYLLSSPAQPPSPTAPEPAASASNTLSSTSATIKPKSPASNPSFPGKMFAKTLKTATTAAVAAPKTFRTTS